MREDQILKAVPCPLCRALKGAKCVFRTDAERAAGRGRLLVHSARRKAWQEWKRVNVREVDFYVRSGRAGSGWIVPQSERAKTAVLSLVQGAFVDPERGSIYVPNLGEANKLLRDDGWVVE